MLTRRSMEKEFLDLGPAYYSRAEYLHFQKIIFKINKWLGFFASTLKFLRNMPSNSKVIDVGCGGGLFILHLSRYFPQMQFEGLDISKEAIHVAHQALIQWKKSHPNTDVSFSLQPQNQLHLAENSADVVLTTLVCHHLTDSELVDFLQRAHLASRYAVVINDLHRHVIPHLFYRLTSYLLFRNRMVSHDGLISIRRSFKRSDWERLLTQSQIKNYQIKWYFPFRWQVILWKK